MISVNNGKTILKYLKEYKVPTMKRAVFDAHTKANFAKGRLMADLFRGRDALWQQDDWHHALAAIIRRAPDERGMLMTVLPNRDTLAALLAVRLGINMHLAVALAYDDAIEAWDLNSQHPEPQAISIEDAVILATFRLPSESHARVALAARKDVVDFSLRFGPEELCLFDQHPKVGLHLPFLSTYFEKHPVSSLGYQTDEAVYWEDMDAPLIDAARLKALHEELASTQLTISADVPDDVAKQAVRDHARAVVERHLGQGACATLVRFEDEPIEDNVDI